jgi:hypothetical protein
MHRFTREEPVAVFKESGLDLVHLHTPAEGAEHESVGGAVVRKPG